MRAEAMRIWNPLGMRETIVRRNLETGYRIKRINRPRRRADVRLRELKIKNFRKLDDLTVVFPRGLCVIGGENNTGKTAIIDALRLMLMPSRDLDASRSHFKV